MRKGSERPLWHVQLGCFVVIAAAVYIHLTNGEFDMTVSEVLRTLLRIHPQPDHDMVLFEFRLPRIVIAALVGFGLGIAGAVIQGVTRNGLADPGILGINAGAGAAIVLFMFFFQGNVIRTGWTAIMMMPLFGLIGGLAAAALIYFFAWQNGRLDPQRLVLTGIAIGSGFGAFTMFLSLQMNAKDFEMATVWLTGSIWNANWVYIASMLPWFIVLVPVLMRRAPLLDVFQLEESSVKGLGVRAEREKSLFLLGSIGLVSACVSVSGSIGFVGLLAPHIAKRLVGLRHRRVMSVCGLIGMMMVIVSDLIAKTVFSPAELPVGIVISIVGVPYFVYLLFKAKA
ncbi:FecCD family ABC transporter permease [Paenibacillus naphthalenovorans]|uniref:FecCD family ABC transporter permease n=1 Tax=Paenibacillus naphthalenovorans TaxID=162209 RepID=UPI000886382A|nr:iron ABC transporter permease [Paenibacillus naphthalenovorans]SDI14847.1 iron complex transport system permease protein [Paenibacillus naphthalenovorans]